MIPIWMITSNTIVISYSLFIVISYAMIAVTQVCETCLTGLLLFIVYFVILTDVAISSCCYKILSSKIIEYFCSDTGL